MKHFLVEITYLVPAEELNEILSSHRAFLQIGYEKGWLLLSGPKVPRIGGVVIARAPTLEDLQAFFSNDPYVVNHLAEYKYSEFLPVKHQSILDDWVSE